METSETTGAIAAALAKAHLEIDNPELDGTNPHYKSKFSTLAAVLNAVRKPLAKQGIALMQSVAIADQRVAVTTSMIHASGEWLRETMAFPVANNANIQQAGSLVTYIRRYSLIALCGIVGDPHEDDDGDADRIERNEQKPPARTPRTTRATFDPKKAQGAAPAPAPAEPAPAPTADNYPEDFDGPVKIVRVMRRKGQPHAIQVRHPQHGTAWVATEMDDYADCLEAAVNDTRCIAVYRDASTHVLHLIGVSKPETAEEAAANELPI
jgi:hypothetical protein